MNRADLRAVKINFCRTCILLSAKVSIGHRLPRPHLPLESTIEEMIISKAPEKSEPVLADKEIIMAALNIKTMSFGSDYLKVLVIIIIIITIIIMSMVNDGKIIMILIKNKNDSQDDVEEVEDVDQSPNSVPILLDLAFASNV